MRVPQPPFHHSISHFCLQHCLPKSVKSSSVRVEMRSSLNTFEWRWTIYLYWISYISSEEDSEEDLRTYDEEPHSVGQS